MRVLTYTSLYPSNASPGHGLFVEARVVAMHDCGDAEIDVVSPVPWFPSTDERFGRYARFARTAGRERRESIDVSHPRYPMIPKLGTILQPFGMAAASMPTIRRLERDRGQYDVIDAHYFYPDGVAAAMIAGRLGRPLVITARGSDVNLLGNRSFSRRMIVRAAGQAARVVAVSAALRDRLVALGVERERIEVIRNGVDSSRFRPLDRGEARAQLAIPSEARLIVAVGNLVPEKGHDLIIDAVALLSDACLVIVGEGAGRAELERQVRKRGVELRVRFVGAVPQSELPRYYAAADVVALGSRREGLPNVVLEALACGRPVVATAVGGIPEVVVDGITGRLIADRSPERMAEALRDELRVARTPESIHSHVRRWSWLSVAEAHLATLREACDASIARASARNA
jgi:glycosyltransferase involved in cell wall biosynthesis